MYSFPHQSLAVLGIAFALLALYGMGACMQQEYNWWIGSGCEGMVVMHGNTKGSSAGRCMYSLPHL